MEEQFKAPINGVEIFTNDVDLWSKNAALADDHVLAELLQLAPFTAGEPAKAILPYGKALVVPSGSDDSTVRVRPFRAIIGSRDTIANIGHKENWHDVRSALHIPDVSGQQYRNVQLSATASNNRWDLIWCRVETDIPAATKMRYIKGPTGTVSAQNVIPTRVTTVTIGVTEGTEAASPVGPNLPESIPTVVHIPLAYVYLQHSHTLGDPINPRHIWEAAPVVGLHAASVRPGSRAGQPDGYGASANWDGARTARYAPQTMTGKQERFFQLGGLASGIHTLDDSIDWRQRFFKWWVQGSTQDNYGAPYYFPNAADTRAETGGAASIDDSFDPTICRLRRSDGASTAARVLPAGHLAEIDFWVNNTTGALYVTIANGPAPTNVFLWLEATGQFDLQQATSPYG